LTLQIILAAVSIGVVFAGWRVIYKNAQKIATRNESFSLIRDANETLDRLRLEGVALWRMTDKDEINFYTKITTNDIRILRNTITKLNGRNVHIDSKVLTPLRRALTLNNTKVVDQSIEGMSENISAVYKATERFKAVILSSFEKNHPPLP